MEHLEPALLWIAGLCTAIISIWGATSKIAKPYRDLLSRVIAIEEKVEKNEVKLNADNERLKAQEDFNALSLKSLALLLEHGATGNHNDQMQVQAEEVREYLYGKGGKLK